MFVDYSPVFTCYQVLLKTFLICFEVKYKLIFSLRFIRRYFDFVSFKLLTVSLDR